MVDSMKHQRDSMKSPKGLYEADVWFGSDFIESFLVLHRVHQFEQIDL